MKGKEEAEVQRIKGSGAEWQEKHNEKDGSTESISRKMSREKRSILSKRMRRCKLIKSNMGIKQLNTRKS